MKSKKDKHYKTIADAAEELRVSTDSMRRYIKKGMFPRPRRVFFGTIGVAVFSDKYIADAQETLKVMRANGGSSGKRP